MSEILLVPIGAVDQIRPSFMLIVKMVDKEVYVWDRSRMQWMMQVWPKTNFYPEEATGRFVNIKYKICSKS
jgi:hypothetical protein